MSDFADPLSPFAPVSTDVLPRQDAKRAKSLPGRLVSLFATIATALMTGVLFLGLFAPPIVMAVVSIWAGVTGVRALWDGGQLLDHWQVGSLGTLLPSLNAASRLALFGVSFFAVLFALIVFMGGTFGRGWRQLFLVPGVILAAPSLVVFVQGARLTSVLMTQLGVARPIQLVVFAYLLLDALILALLMTDVRPRRSRNKTQRRPARNSRPRDRHVRNSRPLDGETLERISELSVVPFDLSNPFELEAQSSVAPVEAESEDTRSEVLI